MKYLSLFFVLLIALQPALSDARGGRGGGGRGGGGARAGGGARGGGMRAGGGGGRSFGGGGRSSAGRSSFGGSRSSFGGSSSSFGGRNTYSRTPSSGGFNLAGDTIRPPGGNQLATAGANRSGNLANTRNGVGNQNAAGVRGNRTTGSNTSGNRSDRQANRQNNQTNRQNNRSDRQTNRNTNINSGNRNTVINNPQYGGGGYYGWNGGVAWAPAPYYYGGGFWGAMAIGVTSAAVFGAIVDEDETTHQETTYNSYQVQPNSPGATFLSSYQLTQVKCGPPNLVVVYGPENSVICANPNNNVAAGDYDLNTQDMSLTARQ